MAAWRMRPMPVQQGALTCWAAAISSFSRVTRGVTDFASVPDVVARFNASLPAELNSDGSLKTPSGWIAFAKEFDLEVEEIRINDPIKGAGTATSGITSKVVDSLEANHFVPKLQHSHVIVVIGTSSLHGLSHTVVVYGADRFRLCFMDPLSDPALPLTSPRPAGGSGRVGKNWFCETYEDFEPGPRYLLIWRD